jgi:hypothetical protein
MIVALAGRRIDAPDTKVHRFPFENVEKVEQRLKAFFLSCKASVLVCSAACGSDLLALDIAGELKLQRRIILPFSPDVFKKKSVTDCYGDWESKFDKICNKVNSHQMLRVLNSGDDQKAYERTNVEILNLAERIAQSQKGNKKIIALVVWDGKSRGPDDITTHFLEEAKKKDISIEEISTL